MPDTLLYDGRCPLCSREIDQLRKARPGDLEFIDIHMLPAGDASDASSATLGGAGIPSKDELLRNLHLRKEDGEWLSGADANVEAWRGTRMAPIGRLLRLPGIRGFVDYFYNIWARRRYARLYGSATGAGEYCARSEGE
ncbi:MAG: DUF393 domain-containing protein [Congregibacter sp.]